MSPWLSPLILGEAMQKCTESLRAIHAAEFAPAKSMRENFNNVFALSYF